MSVTYELVDGVAVVTIDRPAKRNAMDLDVFEGVGEAARRASADDAAGALLVRGAEGTFSSGIDVTLLARGGDGAVIDEAFIAGLQASFTAFEEADKPSLALVEGYCLGAGIQLALACHLRVVTPSARLAVAEVRWGLIPDLGGTFRLPRLVGLGRATELTLSGREVDAEEAVRIGLADVAVADADEGMALATRLAAGPGAVRRAPRLLRENLARDRDAAFAAERRAQLACLEGPDVAEAVGARVAGREPRFVGR